MYYINIDAFQCDNLPVEYLSEELKMKTFNICLIALWALLSVTGCAPEVGSEAWCKKIAEKPKGEWTGNETADYAKHCLFK